MYSNQYVENDVLSANPVERVCILYSRAIEQLHRARGHRQGGEIPQFTKAVGRAMETVLELQASLNLDVGGDIAQNLSRLYGYIQVQLGETLADPEKDPLDEVIHLLSDLYEGWKECKIQANLEHSADLATGDPGPATEGRIWTS